jgi:hypothetical protein
MGHIRRRVLNGICFWRLICRKNGCEKLLHILARFRKRTKYTAWRLQHVIRKAFTCCCLSSAQATRVETARDCGGKDIPHRIMKFSITNHVLISRCVLILGAFAKLRKAISSFVVSVRPSAWNDSAPTGRNLIKFDICVFCKTFVEVIQVSLKFGKNRD